MGGGIRRPMGRFHFHRTFTIHSRGVDATVQRRTRLEPFSPIHHPTIMRPLLLLFLFSLSSVSAQKARPADPFVKKPGGKAGPASVDPAAPSPEAPPVAEPPAGHLLFTFETYTLPQEDSDALHGEGWRGGSRALASAQAGPAMPGHHDAAHGWLRSLQPHPRVGRHSARALPQREERGDRRSGRPAARCGRFHPQALRQT